MLPYVAPSPLGAEATATQLFPETFANIYSPSLLPVLFPGLEAEAEKSYSPLTASATFRPLRNPTNLPLVPNTEPPPQGNAITSYQGLQALAQAQPYSNMLSTVRDPAMMTMLQNQQQQFNAQSPLMLPQGTTQPPLAPMQQAEANLLSNQLGRQLQKPQTVPMTLASNSLPAQQPQARFTAPTGTNPGMSAVAGTGIVPTAQQLISVVGVNQLLQMLNKIMPLQFNSQTLLSTPRSTILRALNNLPYDVLLNIFLQLPLQQRASLLMLEGVATTPGEAMMMAQGMYGMMPPTMAEAQSLSNLKKRMPAEAEAVPKPRLALV